MQAEEGLTAISHSHQFTRRSHGSPVFLGAVFSYAINASSKSRLLTHREGCMNPKHMLFEVERQDSMSNSLPGTS